MKAFAEHSLLVATSILLCAIYVIGRLLRITSNSRRLRQFDGRGRGDSSSAWEIAAETGEGTILFFCSSAGEYEQALPIVQRLPVEIAGRQRGFSTLFLFLSQSGLDFFRARGEKGRAGLAPVDTLWNWRALQRQHRIAISIVIRHEWWPAFLHVMGKTGPLILVDATVPASDPESAWKNAARGYLARKFTMIFTVDEPSRSFFIEKYGIAPEKVKATGDTKFDRALDRAQANTPAALRGTVKAAAGSCCRK
jgi:3-deoxy-D-manno-octulosonic-acid transferase